MLYQIHDGSVSLGGELILSHISFQIKEKEKIAIVGGNGSGKTTLLRLLAGELVLDRDDAREGAGIQKSRAFSCGFLRQQGELSEERTVKEEKEALFRRLGREESFFFEYDRMFTRFGFSMERQDEQIGAFSGGEQMRLALIRLLLEKPELLLLDEPTNHLDEEGILWLEEDIRQYPGTVVLVSHDRFFLDQPAQVIYECENHRLTRYSGNYTAYRREKEKRYLLQKRAYERQQEEIARLEELIERFRHKPNKAAMTRAKRSELARLRRIPEPEGEAASLVFAPLLPRCRGSKWVWEAEHAELGYPGREPLAELNVRIRRGQKIGIIGPNGTGKSTLLRTIAGELSPRKGKCRLGSQIEIGYFSQQLVAESFLPGERDAGVSVRAHFQERFPSLTEREVRQLLSRYLFGGRDAEKACGALSGGERARLKLAELLQERPNLLLLDEPTNHMDIRARERLEGALQSYEGTLLFATHDRYFLRELADSLLIFEEGRVSFYPFGYVHYLERGRGQQGQGSMAARIQEENQALLASLEAAPRKEERIPAPSTRERQREWELFVCEEELKAAAEYWEKCLKEWESCWPEEAEKKAGEECLQRAEAAWTRACLTWYETWEESVASPSSD